MDVIWTINFKITSEIRKRKHVCVLLRRQNSFLTVNISVILLEYIFEFVFNTA